VAATVFVRAIANDLRRCNFIIYSAKSEPIQIDNGYEKRVELWFANGEHYDCVFRSAAMEVKSFAQGVAGVCDGEKP
jgi:hypothetical protein